MRTRIIFLLSFLFVAATSATAQTTTDPQWTFGGTAGMGGTWDDEGGMGKGWLLGAYVDRRLSRRVDLELAADVQRHDRVPGGEAQWENRGHTTYLSLAVIRRFGGRSTNCFILGGGTIGIHRGESGFANEPPLSPNDDTHGGVIFGGGLSFRTRGQIEIAPTVRITLMGVNDDSDPVSSIMGGIRIGFGR